MTEANRGLCSAAIYICLVLQISDEFGFKLKVDAPEMEAVFNMNRTMMPSKTLETFTAFGRYPYPKSTFLSHYISEQVRG